MFGQRFLQLGLDVAVVDLNQQAALAYLRPFFKIDAGNQAGNFAAQLYRFVGFKCSCNFKIIGKIAGLYHDAFNLEPLCRPTLTFTHSATFFSNFFIGRNAVIN
ncbi:hypothetical protein D3C87_1402220 [compost metagenome]